MMRTSASTLAICAMVWCVPAGPATAADPLTTITARVLSTSAVNVFRDGVEELAYEVKLKPVDPPGQAIKTIAREPCPRSKDRDQLYSVLINRRPAVFGMGVGENVARPASVTILSCKLVTSDPVESGKP